MLLLLLEHRHWSRSCSAARLGGQPGHRAPRQCGEKSLLTCFLELLVRFPGAHIPQLGAGGRCSVPRSGCRCSGLQPLGLQLPGQWTKGMQLVCWVLGGCWGLSVLQGQAAAQAPALSVDNVPFPAGRAAVAAGAVSPSCHMGMSGGCGEGAQHRVAALVRCCADATCPCPAVLAAFCCSSFLLQSVTKAARTGILSLLHQPHAYNPIKNIIKLL